MNRRPTAVCLLLVQTGRAAARARAQRQEPAYSTAAAQAFADPAVADAMAKQGDGTAISTPEHAQRFFRDELVKYAALVKKAGIEPQ